MAITVQSKNERLYLSLSGEIDHHSCLKFREEMDAAIRSHPCRVVVVDLSGTSFCDSSGLGLILGRVRVAGTCGKTLYVKDASERVKKILDLAGAERFLNYWTEKEKEA